MLKENKKGKVVLVLTGCMRKQKGQGSNADIIEMLAKMEEIIKERNNQLRGQL